MLNASVLSDDPAKNLQLALGVELATLPPYLYALWSIKSPADGASTAAAEAANSIRAVVYEEMLHAGLVGNMLNAIGVVPQVSAHLMTYPGPLPGHTTEPPYNYDVGLGPLSPTAVTTFLRIERPEWEPPLANLAGDWITLGELYRQVKKQLEQLAASDPGAFGGGHQLPPGDNPGPGRLIDIVDLQSALDAVETVVEQGEGHRPKLRGDPVDEDDDDHEAAHFYQFQAVATYFGTGLIDDDRDLHPVIENPRAALYTPAQQAANLRFNEVYTEMLDSLQASLSSDAPRVFGPPTELMLELAQLAAVLRSAGTVPGTSSVAGPTFEYLGSTNGHRA